MSARLNTTTAVLVQSEALIEKRGYLVKELHTDDSSRTLNWLNKEVQLRKNNPPIEGYINVVKLVLDKDKIDLEYPIPPGISLAKWAQKKAVNADTLIQLAIGLTQALAKLHEQSLFHGGLDINHIYIVPESLDLSILYSYQKPTLFSDRSFSLLDGSPESLCFISPEQTRRLNQSVDYRTDFYSLGVVLYFLATGRHPFKGKDQMQTIHRHLATKPVQISSINPAISHELSEIISILINKEPEHRYQSTSGLLYDLQQVQMPNGARLENFKSKDITPFFHISDKLYERSVETEKLKKIFSLVTKRHTQLVLLSGEAGIGKTSFVEDFYSYVNEKDGLIASGTFEDQSNFKPFSGLFEVIRELISRIQSGSEQRAMFWKAKLWEEMGEQIHTLAWMIPEIGIFFGLETTKHPPNNEFRATALIPLLIEFIQVFSSHSPLVLFFDDAHWCDEGCFDTIKKLLLTSKSKQLLIIFSFREARLKENPYLKKGLENIQNNKSSVHFINLRPLSLSSVQQMIIDSFNTHSTLAALIGKIIYTKTLGNPFYLKQFLGTLYRSQLVEFNSSQNTWVWQTEKIRETEVTDNVSDLIEHSYNHIPKSVRQLVGFMACFGPRVDLDTVLKLYDDRKEKILENIQSAITAGILIPFDTNITNLKTISTKSDSQNEINFSVKFGNEKIRKVILTLTNRKERAEHHKKIGLHFYKKMLSDKTPDLLFLSVNHFNQSLDHHIVINNEKVSLAPLNFEAGMNAKVTSAYNVALRYFTQAMKYVEDKMWNSEHDLMWSLHYNRGVCEAQCKNFNTAYIFFKEAFRHSHSKIEKAQVYLQETILLNSVQKFDEALEKGFKGLKLAGVSVPKTKIGRAGALVLESFKAIRFFGKMKPEELLNKPIIQDPLKETAVMQLVNIIHSIEGHDSKTAFYLSLRINSLSMKYGLSPATGLGLIALGQVLLRRLNFKSALEWGNVAVRVAKKINHPLLTGEIIGIHAALIMPWTSSIKDADAMLESGIKFSLSGGSIEEASKQLYFQLFSDFSSGKNLTSIDEKITSNSNHFNTRDYYYYQSIISHLIMFDPGFTPEDVLEQDHRNHMHSTFVVKNMFTFLYYFYTDQDEKALQISENIETHIIKFRVGITDVVYRFHKAILQCRSGNLARKNTKSIHQTLRLLEKLSAHCPENFQHYYFLLKAEKLRLKNKTFSALNTYKDAVVAAGKSNVFNILGLAHERAFSLFLENEFDWFSSFHFSEAIKAYQQWGCRTRVLLLTQKYAAAQNVSTLSPRVESKGFDTFSLIQASQALSKEIHLKALLDTLVSTVMQYAGAQRCMVFLEKNAELHLFAERNSELSFEYSEEGLPLDQLDTVSKTALTIVKQSEESLALGNATHDALLQSDPYIVKNKPKSLLALPIIKLGQFLGVLYLENNYLYDAFSEARVETLQVLGSQAAISIENAKLYGENEDLIRNLEARVEAQVEEIRVAHAEQQKSQELAEKMTQQAAYTTLTRGIAHEIRNPLGMILSGMELILDNIDNKKYIMEYAQTVKRSILRLSNITNTMLKYGTPVATKKAQVQVNEILDDLLLVANAELKKRKITVVKYFDELPQIFADANSLNQAFLNVLLNAAQAIEHKGKIEISTKERPFVNNKGFSVDGIQIIIADDGVGIPEDKLKKIYDPFFTTKYENTGLGLSIVLRIVGEHKGIVNVESKEKEGTTVTFLIPKSIPNSFSESSPD